MPGCVASVGNSVVTHTQGNNHKCSLGYTALRGRLMTDSIYLYKAKLPVGKKSIRLFIVLTEGCGTCRKGLLLGSAHDLFCHDQI